MSADPELKTILVLGAGGFIGSHVVSALCAAGYRVRRAVRPRADLGADEVGCDLASLREPDDWLSRLEGVDAVINAAGILRETHHDRFDAIHRAMPLALAQACVRRGIRRFVQISVLGNPDDGEFIASKHHGDEAVLAALPAALVLRPSVVYSIQGSYGGTTLLRSLAAVPVAMPLPGDGAWMLQPLAAEDLAALVVAGLQRGCHGAYEVGGPKTMRLRDYQAQWRRWLRIPGQRVIPVPMLAIDAVVSVGERLGRGPMGATMWRMLRRGNVAAPDAHMRLLTDFGQAPRPLADALAAAPSHVQDRWQAQLYLLTSPLKLATAAVWLLSAMAGWRTDASAIATLAAGSALATASPVVLARGGAMLDAILALWLLTASRPRTPVTLMGLSVIAYTLILGAALPHLWWDPLGGLAKNLMVLPALAVLWVVSERR